MLEQSGIARYAIAALAFLAVSTASLLAPPLPAKAAGLLPVAEGASPPPQPGVYPPEPATEQSPLIGKQPLPPLTVQQWQRVRNSPEALRQMTAGLPAVSQRSAPPPPPLSPWQLGPQPPGTPNLSNPLLLTDGSVMAHVSCTGTWWRLVPDSTGNYATGTWLQSISGSGTEMASLPAGYTPRFFSSAVLPDGRVIVEGGEYNTSCNSQWTNLGAIYDPNANTWTAMTAPAGMTNIGDAESTVLGNGTYMQADCCQIVAALLNPSTLTWGATGGGKADTYDEEGWTLLPNGNVLTVDIANQCTSTTNGWEIYTSGAGTWSTGSPAIPLQLADCTNFGNASSEMGPQVLRPDGTVVAFGGTLCSDSALTACTNGTDLTTTHSAVYNSTMGTWSVGPDIPAVVTGGVSRNYSLADAPAALEPGGNVLFAASPNYQGFVAPTHFFEYASNNTIAQVADPTDAASFTAFQWNFLVLPTGQIMALETDGPNVWIYAPTGSANLSWLPTITGAPANLKSGATYSINCTQCNGLSQGAAYGDDAQAATNYPIVQITNQASGHVYYARTFNHSNMSVTPNVSGSTNFTVPANIETGPSFLSVIANGIPSFRVTPAVARPLYFKKADFNGDGKADLLLRFSDGTVVIWLMNGGTVAASVNLGQIPLSWQIAGVEDIDGNGTTDIIWRNTDGTVAVWLLNGTATTVTVASSRSLGVVSNSYTIVGTGNFNGGGTLGPEILWRNYSTGDVVVWALNPDGSISFSGDLGAVSTDWQIAGVGDFSNTAGISQILWRNSNSGDTVVWVTNGMNFNHTTVDLGVVPLNWTIVGTGDFDGNGAVDILWRNSADGTQAIWSMNNTGSVSVASISYVGGGNGIPVPLDYQIIATGDFNGDGKADILWRSVSTGTFSIWEMNGANILSQVPPGGLNLTNQWAMVY